MGIPPSQNTTKYGISFGRWDGNVLIIDTTYIDYPHFDDYGTPITKNTQVIERYWIREDNSRLDWTATISDPDVFTETVSFGGSMAWVRDVMIDEFECEL